MPLVLFGALEGILRLTGFQHQPREKTLWKPTISGFVGTYEFYLPTEFAPPGYIWISQANTPFTDRFGFRRPEIPFEKPPGKIRVAFLGGSTTHGGYRPYPERAIRLINDAIGENRYEMLNVACSSYSTHQSVKALERWALPRNPDIVFVYHGWNDMWVAGDGFADQEKDALLSLTGESRLVMPGWLRAPRLTGLLGKLAEVAGGPWPRQRVAFDDFSANLETMARQCAETGARMFVMIRPKQREQGFVTHPWDPNTLLYAQQTFQTTNAYELYRAQSEEIIARQRAVAERHPHVQACDGNAEVLRILERSDAGEFGENVPIWYPDNCHLLDFADEFLAQYVALTIAPEHAEAISNRIASLAYAIGMAEELLREDAPREAAWYVARARERNPDATQSVYLDQLQVQAEAYFEFADLFRTGRWGGSDPDFESKIAKLKRCLEIRPGDYGVMLQIYRVCIYMNRLEEAAEAMAGFQPQSAQHRLEWLSFMLESHLQGQRWRPARRVAEELVQMQPQHPLAREVLQQIPGNI